MIKVYESTEKDYSTNGLGNVLTYKCEEEKNISLKGWKLTVECPIKYLDLIQRDRIVTAQTKEKGVQPFRIGNVEKKGRRIYFTANHVVFDISNYLLSDVRPTGLGPVAYAAWLLSHADQTVPFTAKGEASGTCPTREFVRKTVREGFDQMLEDMTDVIIDPDGWDINVRDSDQVGQDRGQKVVYGRNLQDWQIVEKWDDVCTKILPEGPNGLTLPETYVESDTKYDTPYTKTVTFELPEKDDSGTEYTDDQKVAMLRNKAKAYLEIHKKPKISYAIKSDIPQDLCINDTVTILHPKFELSAHVQGYTYDCNSGRVKSLTFGNYDPSPASTYSSTINDIKNEIDRKANRLKADQEKAIESQTSLIKNLTKNGYVYIDENEIDILDKLPRDQAQNVWRWTMGGLGFSSTGVSGTFTTAITMDGRINADFITTGTLSANLIKAGILQDAKGTNFWNMETGEFQLQALSNYSTKDDTSSALTTAKGYADNVSDSALTNAKSYADTAASSAVDAQTQETIFNKLTNNGTSQGIYLKDGKLYINGDYIKSGTISGVYINGVYITGSQIDSIEDGETWGLTIRNGYINASKLKGDDQKYEPRIKLAENYTHIYGAGEVPENLSSIYLEDNGSVSLNASKNSSGKRKTNLDVQTSFIGMFVDEKSVIWADPDSGDVHVNDLNGNGLFTSDSKLYVYNGQRYNWPVTSTMIEGGDKQHSIEIGWNGSSLSFFVDNINVTDHISDMHLKKEIIPIDDDIVAAIGSVSIKQFKMREGPFDTNVLHYGVIAQSIIKAMKDNNIDPETQHVVFKIPHDTSKDTQEYYGVDKEEFLMARIAYDEKLIDSLAKRIEKLEALNGSDNNGTD